MLGLGPHAAFIVGAYAAVFLVLAGLILWIWSDARTQMRLLEELEARGVARRSARKKRGSGKGKSR